MVKRNSLFRRLLYRTTWNDNKLLSEWIAPSFLTFTIILNSMCQFAIQNEVPRPAVPALPRNLLGMQNIQLWPTDSGSVLTRSPDDSQVHYNWKSTTLRLIYLINSLSHYNLSNMWKWRSYPPNTFSF